ncbi:MAG TPA: hypothetical protein VMZ33_04885 [Candidatus Limnocylindrales bacterium]|nr:hypothetical protein [Candidatus Limnocylindrales bacterium]
MGFEQELRSTSDEMMATLDQLARLESEKRVEQPGTPRFVKLAAEVERVAALVFAQTSGQRVLAERSAVEVSAGGNLQPIDEVPALRDVSVILADWREAERVLATSTIETAEHAKAVADVRRFRDEYHRAHQSQRLPGSGTTQG